MTTTWCYIKVEKKRSGNLIVISNKWNNYEKMLSIFDMNYLNNNEIE